MSYRYIMTRFIVPDIYEYRFDDTDHEGLNIEIPMPYTHDKKEAAQKDGRISCRFAARNGDVVLAFFPSSHLETVEDTEDSSAFRELVDGDPCYYMTYDEFRKLGGVIWECPSIMCSPYIPGSSQEEIREQLENLAARTQEIDGEKVIRSHAVDVTFSDLYPSLTSEGGLEYICGLSEHIAEVTESE